MFGTTNFYMLQGGMTAIFILMIAWTVIWKGLGLWYAAGNKQKGWFIAILILNTLGLLPIIYLLWFKPKGEQPFQQKTKELSFKKKPAQKKAVKKKDNQKK